MFIAAPSDWPTADPPQYLVTGDVAIWLQSQQTIAAFSRVGIPEVYMTTASLKTLIADLDPYLEYPIARVPPVPTQPSFIPINDPVVDGGGPDTIYAAGSYDGGDSNTDFFVDSLDVS